ncbi:MAG TPA: hypothetical protein PLJ60_09540 [Chryseolinea sp.]|nr:hypothetical protein [Chryseolinea sp.]
MKRFTLISIFIIFYLTAFPQKANYQPAKIVLENGDTLTGFVANASLNKIYNEIKFKRSEADDYIKINAKEVLRLSFSNNYVFESLLVKYDPESQKTGSLPTQKEPLAWKEDRIFLEVVAGGDLVSLLMFEDKEGRLHFFIKQNESITELLNRSFRGAENEAEIRANKKYIGQLRSTFLDCPDAIIKDNLRYDRASLLAVFNKYTICKGGKPDQVDHGKGVTTIGFVADFFYEFRKYDVVKNGAYGVQQFSLVGFSPGLSLEIRSKKPYKKLSIYQELHYKSQSKKDISFKESSLELLVLPRTNYTLKSGGNLYWNTGFTFSYIFKREIEMSYPQTGLLGNMAIVTGLGVHAVKSKTMDLSFELRGKLGISGYPDPLSGIGLVVNFVPKSW